MKARDQRRRAIPILLLMALSLTSLVADEPCSDAVDEALFSVETWKQLGSWLDAYPDCDDGYFAEHISETVSVWLSRSPRELVLLSEAIKFHPSLRSSVLRHIDVLSSEERTTVIRTNGEMQPLGTRSMITPAANVPRFTGANRARRPWVLEHSKAAVRVRCNR